MSNKTLGTMNLISKKLFILLSILLVTSYNDVSCIKYNRGPLTESYPAKIENVDENEDDEFTGSTYIEPSDGDNETKDESMLEVEDYESKPSNNNEENYDDEEGEDEEDGESGEEPEDFLDRMVDSSLLELDNKISDKSNKLNSYVDRNSKKLNDNKLKNYLKKIGAIDSMKRAKARGKQAITSVGSTINSIPNGIRRIKEKINPPNPYYNTIKLQREPKGPHGRRLLNTMNEVDERRRRGNNENKVPHGRRLLNTMNEVDENRRRKEIENTAAQEQKAGRQRKVLHVYADKNDGIEEKEPPRYGNFKLRKKK